MSAPPPLHHLALRVSDLEAACAFWHEKVGLEVVARHHTAQGAPRSVWLALGGGAMLMLEHTDRSRSGPSDGAGGFVWALAIPPSQRAAFRAELARRGVAVVHETPFTFYVEDTEGNRLGFSHYPEPASRS